MIFQSYHFIVKGLDCTSSSISRPTSQCRCKTLRGYATLDIILTIYVWRLVLMTLLPLTIIITVNILIMNKLFNENSFLDHGNTSDNARRKVLLLHKISRMLVIVSSIYLLLHVPGSTLEIIKFMVVHAFQICSVRWQYYISITQEIFDLLTNFNYAINFYLYIISGKHIRKEFMRDRSLFRLSKTTKKKQLQRSSYFTSSCKHPTRNSQRDHPHIKFDRCPTSSSV